MNSFVRFGSLDTNSSLFSSSPTVPSTSRESKGNSNNTIGDNNSRNDNATKNSVTLSFTKDPLNPFNAHSIVSSSSSSSSPPPSPSVPLGTSLERARSSRLTRSIRLKRLLSTLLLPTSDFLVKYKLREWSSPVCFHGESVLQRRERLRALVEEKMTQTEREEEMEQMALQANKFDNITQQYALQAEIKTGKGAKQAAKEVLLRGQIQEIQRQSTEEKKFDFQQTSAEQAKQRAAQEAKIFTQVSINDTTTSSIHIDTALGKDGNGVGTLLKSYINTVNAPRTTVYYDDYYIRYAHKSTIRRLYSYRELRSYGGDRRTLSSLSIHSSCNYIGISSYANSSKIWIHQDDQNTRPLIDLSGHSFYVSDIAWSRPFIAGHMKHREIAATHGNNLDGSLPPLDKDSVIASAGMDGRVCIYSIGGDKIQEVIGRHKGRQQKWGEEDQSDDMEDEGIKQEDKDDKMDTNQDIHDDHGKVNNEAHQNEELTMKAEDTGPASSLASSTPAVPSHIPALPSLFPAHTFHSSSRYSRVLFHPHHPAVLFATSFDRSIHSYDLDHLVETSLIAPYSFSSTIPGKTPHSYPTYALSIHPDGSLLFSGDSGGCGILWDLRTSPTRNIWTLDPLHTYNILSSDFHPNGFLLSTGGGDNKAIIWDIRGKGPLHVLLGHSHSITNTRWKPDWYGGDKTNRFPPPLCTPGARSITSSALLTSSYDHTIKIWNGVDFTLVNELRGARDKVTRAEWGGKGGEEVVGIGFDRMWRTWGEDQEELGKEIKREIKEEKDENERQSKETKGEGVQKNEDKMDERRE